MMSFFTILAIIWYIYEVKMSSKIERKINQMKKAMKKGDGKTFTCDRKDLSLWSDKELYRIMKK